MYIGLSLSNCVKDILKGKIATTDIAFIICGTLITDRNSLFQVINIYGESYWKGHSLGEIFDVLTHLYLTGKIFQPRAIRIDTCNVAEGWWAETSLDEIQAMIELLTDKPKVKL